IGEMISDTVVSAVSGSRLGALGRLEAGADVAGARPVVVDNFAGSIRVEAGASGRVEAEAEVRARTQEDVAAVTLTVRPEGDAIQVVCEGGPLPWRNAYARLVVRVPAGSPVDATTRGGSVQVNGTGAEVRARTAGGSIRTSGTAGPADLETQGGSIQMEDHHGPVEAVTMGGSIAMAGRLGPSVSARTAGGSIRVRGVEGTVTADTAGGSVHIDGRLTGDCLVTNVGGSVTVVVPADNGLRVDARGVAVSSDFADLVGGRSELHGTIGAGEDGTLSIRAMAGAVRIRSASPAGRPAAGR
ncbi:MAG TPA: hypothetical protein VFH45_04780, partial [Acidimicrobiales bacterium]|nr:hypothetical protein [Acidimicrobiales bacterium]